MIRLGFATREFIRPTEEGELLKPSALHRNFRVSNANRMIEDLRTFVRQFSHWESQFVAGSRVDLHRFVAAEAESMHAGRTSHGTTLVLHAERARHERQGYRPSWVFRRLVELSQRFDVFLYYANLHEAGISRRIPRRSGMSWLAAVDLDPVRPPIEMGESITHELTNHIYHWANGRISATGHTGTPVHHAGRGYSSDNLTDIEADILHLALGTGSQRVRGATPEQLARHGRETSEVLAVLKEVADRQRTSTPLTSGERALWGEYIPLRE